MPLTSADIRDLGYEVPDGNGPAIPLDRAQSASKPREGRARLVRHERGRMNRTEAAYAEYLESLRRAGVIKSWKFEPMRFILAPQTTYLPDFHVVLPTGDYRHEYHEVKGRWLPEARVKIKVAAAKNPDFVFKAIKKRPARDGGGWEVEMFNA